jgi:hypothetical protein
VPKVGLSFDCCPKWWLQEEARDEAEWIVDAHWLREKGLMQYAGGRLDQCPRWLEAMDVIEVESQGLRK